MRLQPPESVRALQRALYRKAKSEPTFRVYLLDDKVHRADVLHHAWALVRANDGAPGVDRVTVAAIEAGGLATFLTRLAEALRTHTDRPDPVRRVRIPKRSGGERPLGIPTVRDRVVQAAARLVLEPPFEADFQPCSYGFRPKKDAHQAVEAIRTHLAAGYTQVLDADLSAYFDSIPHDRLMMRLAEKIADADLDRRWMGEIELHREHAAVWIREQAEIRQQGFRFLDTDGREIECRGCRRAAEFIRHRHGISTRQGGEIGAIQRGRDRRAIPVPLI